MPQFGSEPKFEPELFRTGPKVRSKVRWFCRTGPQVRFGVRARRKISKPLVNPVRTELFCELLREKVLVCLVWQGHVYDWALFTLFKLLPPLLTSLGSPLLVD